MTAIPSEVVPVSCRFFWLSLIEFCIHKKIFMLFCCCYEEGSPAEWICLLWVHSHSEQLLHDQSIFQLLTPFLKLGYRLNLPLQQRPAVYAVLEQTGKQTTCMSWISRSLHRCIALYHQFENFYHSQDLSVVSQGAVRSIERWFYKSEGLLSHFKAAKIWIKLKTNDVNKWMRIKIERHIKLENTTEFKLVTRIFFLESSQHVDQAEN